MRIAEAILANSDGGVPERVFEYLCWRAGVAWTDVLQRVETARDREAGTAASRLNLGVLSLLAHEFDDAGKGMDPGNERNDPLRELMRRMRAAATVESRAISSLAQSPVPGDRLGRDRRAARAAECRVGVVAGRSAAAGDAAVQRSGAGRVAVHRGSGRAGDRSGGEAAAGSRCGARRDRDGARPARTGRRAQRSCRSARLGRSLPGRAHRPLG